MVHQVADHLAHTFVVKDDRNTAGSDKYGDAIADDERMLMIDLKSISIHQGHRERSKRHALTQGQQCMIEIFGFHQGFHNLELKQQLMP